MPLPSTVNRMDDRLDALRTSLFDEMPARHRSDALKHYTAYSFEELQQGVLTLLSAGEDRYSQHLGMVAKEGTQTLMLAGKLQPAEQADGLAVEQAELDLCEAIKTWVRLPTTGYSLALISLEHSRQLEAPYGWVAAKIEVGPPTSNIY